MQQHGPLRGASTSPRTVSTQRAKPRQHPCGPPAAPAPAAMSRREDRLVRGSIALVFSVGSRLSGGPMWGSLPSGLYISLCGACAFILLPGIYILCILLAFVYVHLRPTGRVVSAGWIGSRLDLWFGAPGRRSVLPSACEAPPTYGKGGGSRLPKSCPLQFFHEGVCLC